MELDEQPQAENALKYRRIVQAISETPWALLPSTLHVITDLIAFRAEGHRLSEEEIRERINAGPGKKQPYASAVAPSAGAAATAVAVLPLYGVITPRATLMSDISGGTSIDRFQQAFRQVLADPSISAVLIDVDSPGGSTDLIPEMAAEIRDARGRKPIVAIANTLAASGAYWLACQADELVVTPSGEVGSIGVYCAHQDVSGLQEKLGVKTTLISAGKFKTEGNPFEPLSDEARQAIQTGVDEFYGMFVNDVAAGRDVAASVVRNGFGEGRVVTAGQAVQLGMADRVDTFDATLARMLQDTPAPPSGSRGAAAGDHEFQAAAAAPAPDEDGELAALTGLLRQTHHTLAERTPET